MNEHINAGSGLVTDPMEPEAWSGQYCYLETWTDLYHLLKKEFVPTSVALEQVKLYRHNARLKAANIDSQYYMYSAVQFDFDTDAVHTVSVFKNCVLTDKDLDRLIKALPNTEFGMLYPKRSHNTFMKLLAEEKSKRIVPMGLKEANHFIDVHHRHHEGVRGHKFSIGLMKTANDVDTLIGVAICGRPVSRVLDNELTLEVTRLCTIDDKYSNSCSMLYSACAKIAKDMGYKKIQTYILESESGNSLKASNFLLEAEHCGGKYWTGKRSKKISAIEKAPPEEYKQRWAKYL